MLFKSQIPKDWLEKPSTHIMSTQIDPDLRFTHEQFKDELPHHYRSILSEFKKASLSLALFHLIFLSVGLLETCALFCLVPWIHESFSLAIVLGTFFLTLFSYLVLLFYYSAKKPEQFDAFVEKFMTSCKGSLGLFPKLTSHHLSVADALVKLSQYLTDYEGSLLQVSDKFPTVTKFISKCSVGLYWRDVFQFKQQLLEAAVQEHLHQIRLTPTDLELHASLASTYVELSQIYKEPKNPESPRPHLNFYKKHAEEFRAKFKTYGNLAIEEFKILNHYAPNDPWIHEQLAAGYHALSMPQEEIREIELLLKLRPNDKEALFQLGCLYFSQGSNARGLQIYEELQNIGYKKAATLIACYGQSQ